MVSKEEVVAFLDEEALTAPEGVKDAIRIVRGHLRRHRRPSSVEMRVVEEEEPITAKHHFAKATEELKKASEPPEGH